MLPVPHQACTLATGALRSVCTIIVRPSGSVHCCAVTGGKVIAVDLSAGVVLSRALVSMATSAEDRRTRAAHEIFGAGRARGSLAGEEAVSGKNGFTKAS